MAKIAALSGWGWQDVERHWLRDRAVWQVQRLRPLREVVDLGRGQPSTVAAAEGRHVLSTDDLRPDWLLVLPRPGAEAAASPALTDEPAGSQRFFAVDGECLLIPTVGDISGAPVVVPEAVIRGSEGLLMVPVRWLPVGGLAFPRALAIILDHPFVRLQRRLAGAYSTVTHITREEIGDLLVPDPPAAKWQAWEADLRQAQEQFIAAAVTARKAIDLVEAWYT
jgi:hypothetical protein